MTRWLTSLEGQRIALTGKAWRSRKELIRQLRGRATPEGRLTTDTTLLVRGSSENWAYKDFGRKEKRAARLLLGGQRIWVVDDFEFRKLLENGQRARLSDRIAGQPVQWLANVTERQFQAAAAFEVPLDPEHSTRGRVEQSFLRRYLFGEVEESSCSLCGRRLPQGLLIAAHIKPRSECSRRERLDVGNVVFGVCLLGCDALYERGFLTVLPEGQICPSGVDGSQEFKKILQEFRGKQCPAWKGSNADYFAWHASRKFQGR
jgi:hypothetical protein